MDFPIDIVITWVDQNDPNWLAKYRRYKRQNHDEDAETRFRDYGTLPYVFRSIEKYAPWVHKVFLITDDQAPSWLNKSYEKLVLINHKDYIDSKYLPTFDSNLIELSLIKLDRLSEHFVCFNDDTFLNRSVQPSDFFDTSGKPRDTLAFNAIMPMSIFDHIHVNNISIINNRYQKRERIKHLITKLFNWHNGPWNFFSLLLLPWPHFTRFYDPHIPISFLKSTMQKLIAQHPEIISATGIDHFRSERDYSNWVVRYDQMLSGNFSPRKYNFGVQYTLDNIDQAIADIQRGKHHLLNINDSNQLDDQRFETATRALRSCFELKFSQRSKFEI